MVSKYVQTFGQGTLKKFFSLKVVWLFYVYKQLILYMYVWCSYSIFYL